MSIHLIVDGYNLIRQSKSFRRLDRQSLELGRDALLDEIYFRQRNRSQGSALVRALIADLDSRLEGETRIAHRAPRAGQQEPVLLSDLPALTDPPLGRPPGQLRADSRSTCRTAEIGRASCRGRG